MGQEERWNFLTEHRIELHYTLKACNFRLMQKFCHLFGLKGYCESVRAKMQYRAENCINSAERVSTYCHVGRVSK